MEYLPYYCQSVFKINYLKLQKRKKKVAITRRVWNSGPLVHRSLSPTTGKTDSMSTSLYICFLSYTTRRLLSVRGGNLVAKKVHPLPRMSLNGPTGHFLYLSFLTSVTTPTLPIILALLFHNGHVSIPNP